MTGWSWMLRKAPFCQGAEDGKLLSMKNSEVARIGELTERKHQSNDAVPALGKRNWSCPRLRISACLTSDSVGDYRSLVDQYEGQIFVEEADEEIVEDKEIFAGKISAERVCLGQALDEHAPFSHLIDVSQTVMDYCGPLLDGDGEFCTQVEKLFDGDVYDRDIVLITEVLIKPQFRGSGLGLWAMRLMMTKMSPGAGLIVIKPFPLQFDHNMLKNQELCREYGITELPKKKVSATRKLTEYYAKLGFRRLPKTPLMVASTAMRLPSLDSLGLPDEG
jgi:hypothetical protein